MSFFKKISLSMKVTLVLALSVLLVLGSILMMNMSQLQSLSMAKGELEGRNAGVQYAMDLQNRLSSMQATLKSLADQMAATRQDQSLSREQVIAIMQHTMSQRSDLFAMYTIWEPNAFDGKDDAYKGKPGHDATGRYVPYFARSEGKVGLEALVDYDKPGPGDYYQVPKATGKDFLTEPYSYAVGGKNVLMTSFMVPLLFDGKFLGETGVDIALDALAGDVMQLKPLGAGYVALLSQNGGIVSHPDTALLGKSLADSGLDTAAWQDLIANPRAVKEIADPAGVALEAVAVPIPLTPDTTWFAVVVVPKSVLFASVSSLATTSIIVIAIAAGFMAAIGWALATRFRKRLAAAGIPAAALDRLVCPIGIPGIESKEPAAIAVSVAADLQIRRERLLASPEGKTLHVR